MSASTEQVVLRSQHVELTVLPGLGARLHSLRVDGHELLRAPDDVRVHEDDPFFWGGYVMAPWCNRVATGPQEVAGREIDLASNFPDGSAIHGLVYAAPWQRTGAGSFAIEREGEGWPWRYRVELAVGLEDASLTLAQRLVNLSDGRMPGGIGLHPWFVGRPEIKINSAQTYGPNSDPTAEPVPVSGELDLRTRAAMAEGLDAAWTEVRDPQVELWWREPGQRAVWHMSTATPHVVAANPPERRAMAVEPQTHAVQGLRRLLRGEPGALALVEPGAALELVTRIDFDLRTS